ncbi:hypothetical protein CONPUDRAFT_157884 [Coniophora puteana RWD-64-598 SS2]|uniref:Uncharacterized protein n=1 Tax=Coniophora puteana (strain RWD-64-598) TaxID=741705 RepID=A0A5M3MDR5_CONPW|nr:uncharacterized protein CONPUDRAFT_157884 [Coniophora puteana RWD-64-598 SS2]EIW76711.1 hypothetical protein CONPUDRAFT_157884 [Coniophora puteana RWD-64-598 SS2]
MPATRRNTKRTQSVDDDVASLFASSQPTGEDPDNADSDMAQAAAEEFRATWQKHMKEKEARLQQALQKEVDKYLDKKRQERDNVLKEIEAIYDAFLTQYAILEDDVRRILVDISEKQNALLILVAERQAAAHERAAELEKGQLEGMTRLKTASQGDGTKYCRCSSGHQNDDDNDDTYLPRHPKLRRAARREIRLTQPRLKLKPLNHMQPYREARGVRNDVNECLCRAQGGADSESRIADEFAAARQDARVFQGPPATDADRAPSYRVASIGRSAMRRCTAIRYDDAIGVPIHARTHIVHTWNRGKRQSLQGALSNFGLMRERRIRCRRCTGGPE